MPGTTTLYDSAFRTVGFYPAGVERRVAGDLPLCRLLESFCGLSPGNFCSLSCPVPEGSEKLAEAARTPCSESICSVTLLLLSPTMCLACAEQRQEASLPSGSLSASWRDQRMKQFVGRK